MNNDDNYVIILNYSSYFFLAGIPYKNISMKQWFINLPSLQRRDLNEYWWQLCKNIGLFISIKLWVFTVELHPAWNDICSVWVYDLYPQGLQCMNWNAHFWKLCWDIGFYNMVNFKWVIRSVSVYIKWYILLKILHSIYLQ